MQKLIHLPVLFVLALLGAFTLSVGLPSGGAFAPDSAVAEEAEDGEDEGGDDGGGEFYDEETSFSGAQVTKAIVKGVTWLLRKQGRNGSWGGIKGNAVYGGGQATNSGEDMLAGPTSLALYALLKCKQPLKDPRIRKGFDYLWKNHREPETAYETSAMLLAVCATADNSKMSATRKKTKKKPKLAGRYRGWANKLAKHLVDMRTARGWRYNRPGRTEQHGGPEDTSSTQLALLALFAANNLGVRVKDDVWEDALAFTLEQQDDDGPEVVYQDPIDPKQKRTAKARGFAYIKQAGLDPDEGEATGGMTACGLGNLEMCRYMLSDAGRKRDEWNKRPDAAKVQTAIYDGIAWLEKNWSPFQNPRKKRFNVYHIYYMYALERAMDLLSLRLVGSHRWYNEMGQELLNRQRSEGFWKAGGTHEPGDTLDTCFALLFLKRATKGSIPFGSVTGGSEDAPADNR